MISIFQAPEGGGKTAMMTVLSCLHMYMGGKVRTFPGYECHAKIPKRQGGHTVSYLEVRSEPIQIDEFIKMGDELKDTLIDIDELQNFAGSESWNTVLSRILYWIAGQRRKRNLGMLGTIQNFDFLNPRLRWMTHYVFDCWDVYFTQWGKENHIPRGHQINLSVYDMKGFQTGVPGSLWSMSSANITPIWECYDTYGVVDPREGMVSVELKKRKLTVDANNSFNVIGQDTGTPDVGLGNAQVPVVSNPASGLTIEQKQQIAQRMADANMPVKGIMQVMKDLNK